MSNPQQDSIASQIKHKSKVATVKPKKNKSAFLLFTQEMRHTFRQNEIPVSPNRAMKKLAQLWTEMQPDAKNRFQALAQRDKERYLQEKQVFLSSNPSEINVNKTKKNYLKKPSSAYATFLRERFAQTRNLCPNLQPLDIIEIISNDWRNFSKQDSTVYKEKAIHTNEMKIKHQECSLNNAHVFVEDDEEDELAQTTKKIKGVDSQCTNTQPATISSQRFQSTLSEHPLYSEEDAIYESSATIDSPEATFNFQGDSFMQTQEDSLLEFCSSKNWSGPQQQGNTRRNDIFFFVPNQKPIDLSSLNTKA